ncbi:NADH-quinone oxidoreductase subunit J [compost metagenome]
MGTEVVGPKVVGQALFTHYLLLVEVAAMLLLAALVAAFHLGKREPGAEEDKQ